MDETKLTGLLLSFFYEGSLLHETLMQKPDSKLISIFKSYISDLHQKRSPNHSEFKDVSNTIQNIVHRNQQNSVISWCQLGYSHLIVTVFRYILSLPFFIMRMSKIGDYLLSVQVPATEPNYFVRSDSLLCNQVTTDVLKTHPSPVLILHLHRESSGNVLPSIEVHVDVKLDGQNAETRKYGLQTVICLNSANELVTYIRKIKNTSEIAWSIIKSREWNYFSKSDLPDYEEHLRFVSNLKDFACIQLEGIAEHSVYMMQNCLFLVYVPIQVTEHVPEAAACKNLIGLPKSNNSNLQDNVKKPIVVEDTEDSLPLQQYGFQVRPYQSSLAALQLNTPRVSDASVVLELLASQKIPQMERKVERLDENKDRMFEHMVTNCQKKSSVEVELPEKRQEIKKTKNKQYVASSPGESKTCLPSTNETVELERKKQEKRPVNQQNFDKAKEPNVVENVQDTLPLHQCGFQVYSYQSSLASLHYALWRHTTVFNDSFDENASKEIKEKIKVKFIDPLQTTGKCDLDNFDVKGFFSFSVSQKVWPEPFVFLKKMQFKPMIPPGISGDGEVFFTLQAWNSHSNLANIDDAIGQTMRSSKFRDIPNPAFIVAKSPQSALGVLPNVNLDLKKFIDCKKSRVVFNLHAVICKSKKSYWVYIRTDKCNGTTGNVWVHHDPTKGQEKELVLDLEIEKCKKPVHMSEEVKSMYENGCMWIYLPEERGN